MKIALAQYIWSSSLFLLRFFTKSSIIPSVWMAALQLSCRDTAFTAVNREMTSFMCWYLYRSPTINRSLHVYTVPLTTDANSCRLPTTGISMFSFEDLSKRASRGIPPALLMATLILVLLLQLHRASAAQRATSTLFSWSALGLTEFGSHSSSFTWN